MLVIEFVFAVIGTPERFVALADRLGITEESLEWLFDDTDDEE